MATHNCLGEKGEEMAAAYLRNNGYSIVATNWRDGKNELDIIARIADLLVIAEVKTRTTPYFGLPEEAVTQSKIEHIMAATESYITQYDITQEVRFDIISVILPLQGEPIINHIKDAFYASL